MSRELLRIEEAGLVQVTDLGRVRGPRHGLSVNGALDQGSAKLATALLGRDDGDPVLEVLSMNFAMTMLADTTIAVTGAQCDLLVDGVAREHATPVAVERGQTVRVARIRGGVRVYIAVDAELEAPTLLRSCAPDADIGFGLDCGRGRVLRASVVRAPRPVPEMGVPLVRQGETVMWRWAEPVPVEILPGPDLADFVAAAWELYESPYVVCPASNHVGLRLAGRAPVRITSTELRSRGVPIGAIEVAASDELLVLLRGRGITAGYRVVAVATTVSQDRLGQVRPGDLIRFRSTTVADATTQARERDGRIARVRALARARLES